MRTLILSAMLGLLASAASAQSTPAEYNPAKSVIKSSGTTSIVLVSTSAPTLVDIASLSTGSFSIEIQNRSTTDNVCCGFDANLTTSTLANSGKGCREIAKNLGSWTVSRWWQNLKLYCQSLSTSTPSPVASTQGN